MANKVSTDYLEGRMPRSASHPFRELFSDPPASCRGLDTVHQVRNRRRYREVWHHRPKDPSRSLTRLSGRKVDPVWYGPHPELEGNGEETTPLGVQWQRSASWFYTQRRN